MLQAQTLCQTLRQYLARHKGLFITFEGGEAVGKSTQLKNLSHALQDEGIPVLMTREPGGTSFGNKVRSLVLSHNVHVQVQTLLFLADRMHHLQEVILPFLEKGGVVLCDRYVDSMLVYQGYVQKVGLKKILGLHEQYGITLKPNLTFLCDAPLDISLRRCQRRRLQHTNFFDKKKRSFHEKVQRGFRILARLDSARYRCIDTSLPTHKTAQIVCDAVQEFLTDLSSVSEK